MQHLIVLKLGGSVLRDESSLPRAVHEIHRFRRLGYGVVAVVSALAGETDRLLARALGATPLGTAALAAGGEHRAAGLLGETLDRAGIGACVLTPASLGLLALGTPLASEPFEVDRARVHAALALDRVAVVPGFSGLDAHGRTVLFGRGGSDLTALFLAAELGARCRLVKDVPGLFERDPDLPGPPPRRYAEASFEDALATDGSILQHAAVRFARARGLAFDVAALGGACATRVGPGPSRFASAPAPVAGPLRVALLGLGTVGGGVWSLAQGLPHELEVVATLNRDTRRADALGVPRGLRAGDVHGAVRGAAQVVVECLGGREPALSAIAGALGSGRSVVTANKRVLAAHGDFLRGLARASGARLLASAAVGGAAPVLERIHGLREAGAAPLRARGVLNGTANFVLERLSRGAEIEVALADARARGLAEREPAAAASGRGQPPGLGRDLDGRDAGDKLLVLADVLGLRKPRLALEAPGPGLAQRALDAARRGHRLRQVAEISRERGQPRARVRLLELTADDALHGVEGAGNAVVLTLPDGTRELVTGAGAGRWPTAESVVGDLLHLARLERAHAPPALEPAVASRPTARLRTG